MIKNYHQLVPRYLLANKRTSMSMVISILFSVMLLVSVGMISEKYNNTRIEMAQEMHGKYNGAFLGIDGDSLNKLRAFDGIDRIGTTVILGEFKLNDVVIKIKGADMEALDLLNAEPIKGTLPEKENEIAIEKWIYDKLEYKPQIGERFTLKYSHIDPNGGKITDKAAEFILCGILQDFQDSKLFEEGKAYVTLETGNNGTVKYHRTYEQWFTLKSKLSVEDTLIKIQKYATTRDSERENILANYRPNIFYNGALKSAQLAKGITKLFNVIVAVAVAMVIYNVFNISVLQRKKHYGLLRAIGITQKQIKFLILFEALLYGAIVIPLGILLGIFSTALITKIIGGAAFKGPILNEINAYNLLVPVVVSLISILAAVINPAKLAARISPIESLTLEDGKANMKAYKTYKARRIDRFLGYTGKMAINNLKRYKKRFIATVIAMGIGIALFIFSTYIIEFLNPITIVDNRTRGDYVLGLSNNIPGDYGYGEDVAAKLEDIPGIKVVNKFKCAQMSFILDSSFITPGTIKEIEEKKNPLGMSLRWGKYHVMSQIYGCSDDFIENLRKTQSDNKAEVFILQNLNNENFTTIKNNDEVELSFNYLSNGKFGLIRKEIKVDSILKSSPIKLNELGGYIAVFVPYKFLEDNFKLTGYQEFDINVEKGADLTKVESELQAIANKQKNGQLISYKEEIEKWREYQLQVGAILLSLVIIIAIVGFINIMNTLNVNIIIRKREFGMLRALGMTKKDMRKILLKESALYGFFSSLIGMLVGYLFVWIVYSFLKRRAQTTFNIDFYVVSLTFLATIALSICSSIVPLKKATSEDIVESIQAVE